MEIKKEIETLQKSREFGQWHRKNKDNYLSYALFMTGEGNDRLEVGYYNRKNDKVTTFCINGCGTGRQKIDVKPEENIFKKPDADVEELDMAGVKMDFPEVVSISQDIQKKKYPAESPIKLIMILQKLDPFGNIYNVTFVTSSFKTLNLKINAENGDVVDEQLVSLVQFPGK